MKKQIKFVCQECGTWAGKWAGKCEGCGAWNTLVEETITITPKQKKSHGTNHTLTPLNAIDGDLGDNFRLKTQIPEFDRVLGGGLVPGSVVLVGGDPGIGKSTLLLQAIAGMSQHMECAYISGEEALTQIKLRAERLKLHNTTPHMMATTDLSAALEALKRQKSLQAVVIDSIQTMMWHGSDSPAGSINQIRHCTHELIHFAKTNNIAIILVGHVTKDGALAGPRVLEHMVDCVLHFEGEKNYDYRILRSIKNRFGATDEIGVFSMQTCGLVCVDNPSKLFLNTNESPQGTAIFASMEGTRPILCEVQALVTTSYFPSPKRTTVGYDHNRLAMIIGVLESHYHIKLGQKDVYVNVSGGLKITEPGADLAVAAAIISASQKIDLPAHSVYFGEISLSGNIRGVSHQDTRIKEAEKLEFQNVFCKDQGTKTNITTQKIQITPLKDLKTITKY